MGKSSHAEVSALRWLDHTLRKTTKKESDIKRKAAKYSLFIYREDKRGNPVYCIRAGISNPSAMMDAHTKDEVLMFMMYRKEIGFLIANVLGLLVYIAVLLYGAMVMRGVIEEKTNRIVEVVVSSVRPHMAAHSGTRGWPSGPLSLVASRPRMRISS